MRILKLVFAGGGETVLCQQKVASGQYKIFYMLQLRNALFSERKETHPGRKRRQRMDRRRAGTFLESCQVVFDRFKVWLTLSYSRETVSKVYQYFKGAAIMLAQIRISR